MLMASRPNAAQRNPGIRFPDSISLHAGYAGCNKAISAASGRCAPITVSAGLCTGAARQHTIRAVSGTVSEATESFARASGIAQWLIMQTTVHAVVKAR